MAGVYYDNWNSLVPRSLMRDDRASHYHIAAFAVLGDYVSDKNGSKVWPSQTTIAERMKITDRKLRDVLKDLERWGWLKIDKLEGAAGRRNVYTLRTGTERSFKGNTVPVEQELSSEEDTPSKDKPNKKEAFELDFEKCWKVYPRKKEKQRAHRAYIATRRKGATAGILIRATQAYAKSVEGSEERFIKHGGTFFGPDEPWKDYVTQTKMPDLPKAICPDCGTEFRLDPYELARTECPGCGLMVQDFQESEEVRARIRARNQE